MELVDTRDLKSLGISRKSSNLLTPTIGTKIAALASSVPSEIMQETCQIGDYARDMPNLPTARRLQR